MQINLTDVLSLEGKSKRFEAELSLEEFVSRLGSYKIIDKHPISIEVRNLGDRKIEITSNVKLSLVIPCDRCLEDVVTPLDMEVFKEVNLDESNADRIEQLDEKDYIDGYNLDVDKLIYGEILINLPMKTLCNEDCKGICNRCGTNLNEGMCDCDLDDAQDPRMSVIRDIFKNFKEV